MAENQNEHTEYARWLSNELNDEELKKLKESGDEKILSKIIGSVDAWSLPELKQEHKQRLDSKINQLKNKKVIPLKKYGLWLAAASIIAFALTLVFTWDRSSTDAVFARVECAKGETKKIVLADNTTIVLNGKSFVEYDSVNWKTNRLIKMEGEAYFDVKQKGKFEVQYNGGSVHVLGTIFNVQNHNGFAAVKCFEGKVKVVSGSSETKLLPGQGVRCTKNANPDRFEFDKLEYDPFAQITSFENAPLQEVCSSLAIRYDLSFEGSQIDFNRNFTGMYKNTDLDTALLMVFEPMGISYSKKGSVVYLKNK